MRAVLDGNFVPLCIVVLIIAVVVIQAASLVPTTTTTRHDRHAVLAASVNGTTHALKLSGVWAEVWVASLEAQRSGMLQVALCAIAASAAAGAVAGVAMHHVPQDLALLVMLGIAVGVTVLAAAVARDPRSTEAAPLWWSLKAPRRRLLLRLVIRGATPCALAIAGAGAFVSVCANVQSGLAAAFAAALLSV